MQDIAASMNAVLQENNFQTFEVQSYYQLVGSGLMDLTTRVLPDTHQDKESIKKYYERMIEIYGQNCAVHTKPYPGITELLNQLRARNLKLNVLSNKWEDYTRKIVQSVLPGYFDMIMGLTKEEEKKPNPVNALHISEKLGINPEEMIYVGDSGIDMKTAGNAGMFAVGVLWGYRDEEELRSTGAQLIVNDPAEILKILK
jgi:phosphoglycolate phosphatase